MTFVTTSNIASMAAAGLLADMLGVRVVFILAGAISILAGVGAMWAFGSSRL